MNFETTAHDLKRSKFNPFHSLMYHIQVTDHFETSAPNDAKMTLNTTKSQLLHIFFANTPMSPKFQSRLLHVAL